MVNFRSDSPIPQVNSGVQFDEMERVNNEKLLSKWEKDNWVEKTIPVHKLQNYISVNKEFYIYKSFSEIGELTIALLIAEQGNSIIQSS